MIATDSPFLILIYGQPLSLKSTLAVQLAWRLQCGVVSTGFFGQAICQGESESFRRVRNVRYEACSTLARCYLSEGWSVVVEGNFSDELWRRRVLRIARELKTPVGIIRCLCSDAAELRGRQNRRVDDRFALDRGARPYELGALDVDMPKMVAEELEDLLTLGVFELDTGSWSLAFSGSYHVRDWLRDALLEWVESARGRPMTGE